MDSRWFSKERINMAAIGEAGDSEVLAHARPEED